MPLTQQPGLERMRHVYSATPRSVGQARRDVSEFARASGGDAEAVGMIALAVTEACANVAVHAYRDSEAPGEMVVLASVHDGELNVSVVDRGSGLAPRFDSPGIGMGLPLMSQLSDRFEVQTCEGAGTEISMRFALPPRLRLAVS